jgi:lambda family phage minor tail protein L
MSFEAHIQKLELGAVVQLFKLDATALGGDVIYWTPGPLNGEPVYFDSQEYIPLPIEATGFEYSGSGAFPTPKIQVSNVGNLLTKFVIDFKDLVGADFVRTKTFERFLDTGADPDATAKYQPDVFRVERKVTQNKIFIEWELSAAIDQEGIQLPFRQVLRDACTHTYRRYDETTGTFDYTKASCPYTNSTYFTNNGVSTGASNDKCGKKLSDCKLRFGTNGVLPTRAFPGVAKVR